MSAAATVPARRYDLDWLRIGATFLLFPFHVAKTFDVLPMYHIKNGDLSPALDHFTRFVHQWHMPLFFVLAGWAAHASLARRGARGFLGERVQRLLVPFLAGALLLCPVVKYVELLSGISITAAGAAPVVPYDQSFLAFLPSFYTRLDRFTWSHLWFLVYLFTFSALYTPLFTRLIDFGPVRLGALRAPNAPMARGTRGQLASRADGRCSARASVAGLYLPLVPLVLIQTTLRFRWPGVQNLYDDWANVTYYSLFFILGFVAARWPAWEDVVAREWKRAGLIGLTSAAVMTVGSLARGGVAVPTLATPPLAGLLVLQTASAVTGYCLVVAIIGGARRHLSFTTPAREYLVEASLPVYVLHQLAIVLPGYFIIHLAADIPTKFLLLLLTSVTSTMLVYHFVVRPSSLLRALLGIRSRRNGLASWTSAPSDAVPSTST